MTNPFTLLRQAVQAIVDAEWANLQAGIHQPGAHRAEVARQRDGRLNEVYRQIAAIRNQGTDPRFSMETVEDRLKSLATACSILSMWQQLIPPSLSFPSPIVDPDPQQVVALEKDFLYQQADEFLTELSEGVRRVLHQVLELAAPATLPGTGSAKTMIPATEASELSERLGHYVSVSCISKLCRKKQAPFYWQKAPPGSKHKLEVDKGEFLAFVAEKKQHRPSDSKAPSNHGEEAIRRAIQEAHQTKKAQHPLD